MTGVLTDLRYALRGLIKNRGFALVAILSLALGIGANTTIFTLIRAIFLRPLPVHDPETLVAVFTTDAATPGLLLASYPNYRDYRDHNTVFSGLLLYSPVAVSLTGRGEPRMLMAHLVTGNYFDTLGVHPVAGRGFLPEEDAGAGGAAVAVISYPLWQRLFAGDPSAVGRSIELNSRPYTIVGVAPDGFAGLNQLAGSDVFLPLSTYPVTYPSPALVTSRRGLLFFAAGRLKPGVTVAQAESGMNSVAQELERLFPRDNRGRRVRLTPLAESAMDARTRPVVSRSGTLLMIISSLVLLIGCGNVANLLLARAAGGVRKSRCESRWEPPAAAWFGSCSPRAWCWPFAAGSWDWRSHAGRETFSGRCGGQPSSTPGFALELDTPVLLFNLGISVATGILFGLAPALRATQANLFTDLKERSGGGGRAGAVRSTLVVAQVCPALVSLIGAGLFVRSLLDARQIDPGFDAAHLAAVSYNVNDQGYHEERGRDYHERALERAAAVPGVIAAAISKDVPFRVGSRRGVLLEGQDNGPPPSLIRLSLRSCRLATFVRRASHYCAAATSPRSIARTHRASSS